MDLRLMFLIGTMLHRDQIAHKSFLVASERYPSVLVVGFLVHSVARSWPSINFSASCSIETMKLGLIQIIAYFVVVTRSSAKSVVSSKKAKLRLSNPKARAGAKVKGSGTRGSKSFHSSLSASGEPTVVPSTSPTFSPSISQVPSYSPSISLDPSVSLHPSTSPSRSPSNVPSLVPSDEPSLTPSCLSGLGVDCAFVDHQPEKVGSSFNDGIDPISVGASSSGTRRSLRNVLTLNCLGFLTGVLMISFSIDWS